jgi:hypothetical protein
MNTPSFLTYLKAILAGLLCFALTAVSFLPVFGFLFNYLSPLPLFLVAFSLGVYPAGIGAVCAALLFFINFGFWATCVFGAATLGPFLLVCLACLKPDAGGDYPSTYRVLDRVCLWGASITLFVFVSFELYGINLLETIEQSLKNLADVTGFFHNQPLNTFAQLVPGIVVVSWLTHAFIVALIGQKILVVKDMNLRVFTPLTPPQRHLWDAELVLGMMLILAGGFLNSPSVATCGKIVVTFSFFPLLALGLYTLGRLRKKLGISLFFFYSGIFLAFLLVWPLVIIVLLGFAEPWYGLNSRFSKK